MRAGTQPRRRWMRGVAVVGVIAILLGLAVRREVAVGAQAVAAADAAVEHLDWPEAIADARDAAEALAPWSPWPEQGASRLATIARAAVVRGDTATALLAFGALRSAAIATQGVASGGGAWREIADDGLAQLAGAGDDPRRASDRTSAVLRDLRRPNVPGTGSVGVLAVAAVITAAALGSLARGRRVALGRALLAAGFVAFAIVLLMN